MLLTESNNQFRDYESKFSRIFFDQLKQVLQVCLFCVETPNSGFVVSEMVVGSGEQDIELSHPSNFTAFS